jgi:hypothetical protein
VKLVFNWLISIVKWILDSGITMTTAPGRMLCTLFKSTGDSCPGLKRQEILYSNKALENDKRLLEYRVKSRSTLYIMIQAHFDLLINVETFWGKTYRFYLDPCSTGTDIVYAVFNRAFSSNGN